MSGQNTSTSPRDHLHSFILLRCGDSETTQTCHGWSCVPRVSVGRVELLRVAVFGPLRVGSLLVPECSDKLLWIFGLLWEIEYLLCYVCVAGETRAGFPVNTGLNLRLESYCIITRSASVLLSVCVGSFTGAVRSMCI